MILLKRADSSDADFVRLVGMLDEYLANIDGEEHAYFSQFNGLDKIPNVVLAYEGDEAVGCGAFRPYTESIAEIKRMYVRPEFRGRQIGALVLTELETWARELGYAEYVLETGRRQPAAIRLYENCGYSLIPNYDQYSGVESSICMKKQIALEDKVLA